MSEYIVDIPSTLNRDGVYYPDERNNPMPVYGEIVRCRDCLSWHKGHCYKHAYEVANEYGDTFTEGVFQMDDSDFCSHGERRET